MGANSTAWNNALNALGSNLRTVGQDMERDRIAKLERDYLNRQREIAKEERQKANLDKQNKESLEFDAQRQAIKEQNRKDQAQKDYFNLLKNGVQEEVQNPTKSYADSLGITLPKHYRNRTVTEAELDEKGIGAFGYKDYMTSKLNMEKANDTANYNNARITVLKEGNAIKWANARNAEDRTALAAQRIAQLAAKQNGGYTPLTEEDKKELQSMIDIAESKLNALKVPTAFAPAGAIGIRNSAAKVLERARTAIINDITKEGGAVAKGGAAAKAPPAEGRANQITDWTDASP